MPHPSSRAWWHRVVAARRPRARAIRIGRDCCLEDRLAPSVLGDGTGEAAPLAKRRDPGPALLSAPPMPGLAEIDPLIAGAVRRAWQVRVGSATDYWTIQLSPGVGTGRFAELGASAFSPSPFWPGAYVVRFASPQDIAAFGQRGTAAGGVDLFYPDVAHPEVTRFIPNDTLFGNQWNLLNTGQSGGTPGQDANLTSAWDQYTGAGVTIGIVDDGLQRDHPDLAPNYDGADSWDFMLNNNDPSPNDNNDDHGTAVAGIAGARGNNSLGVAGAAFNARLAGLQLLSDDINGPTPAQIASALTWHKNNIDIYNNSWGPADIGFVFGPGPDPLLALQNGATNGRGGRGNVYTWAAGNGLQNNDNVNYDGFANSRFVIPVGAIDYNGKQAAYSEPGSPMLVTTYSDSFIPPNGASFAGITTTDRTGANGFSPTDYTNNFGGTSATAPLASGVIALMLEANPNLTARDVEHILVRTARQTDPLDPEWFTNGAGRKVNYKYGFGAIDALAAVNMAKTWPGVPDELAATSGPIPVNQQIQDSPAANVPGTPVISSFNFPTNMKIEHVEVVFNATHSYRGDLDVVLTSPSGTESVLAAQRLQDYGADYSNWVFSTVRDWDEMSAGTWTIRVDDAYPVDVGTFVSWELRIYGTPPPTAPFLAGLEPASLTYLENQSVPVTNTLTVQDPDSTQMSGAKVSITTNFTAAEDQLLFTPQNGITGTYNNGVLTLTGTATKANYQAALRSVQYHNTSDNPTTADRTISFQITDTDGQTSSAVSRNVIVTPVNDPPSFTVGPDVTVAEDAGPQTIDPWATAISPGPEPSQTVTFEIVSNSNPGLFSAAPAVSPTGVLTFTSAPDANGIATIQVRAKDNGGTANGGQDTSPAQSFTITVTPANDAPVAVGDVYHATEDTVLSITMPGVLGNDKDAEGNPLTAAKLTDPLHGSLTFNPDGSFTYTPAADFNGTDSFTYEANDGLLDSAPGVVTIHVLPVNDPPVAADDTFNAQAGRPERLNVLANDTDVDGDLLRVSSYTRTTKGLLTRSGNSLMYTASPGATGTDTFTYTVSDGHGGTDTATVTLNVTDSIAPKVTAVRLHYGSGAQSVIDLRSLSRSVLPWANVTRVEFVFSEDVQVASGDLTLTGVLGGNYTLDFAYDPVSHTAAWSRASGLPMDRYTLRLSAAAIQDRAGHPLVADWARTFAILPGDFDGNGFVDAKDLAAIKKKFTRPGKPVARFADVNGDGKVDVGDLNAATTNLGRRGP